MTDDEIKAAIAAEGSLNVGNWTYSATSEIVNQFQKYVKDTYGADIKLNYVGSQQPSEYLTKLAADQKAGNPASFDVIAVEENYWYDASQQGLVDDVLDSDLIPNQSMVLDVFKHAPQSIAFQSTAYPGVVYDKNDAGYLTKLMDLADPRLKGKLTLPKPTDITAGGLLLGLASEMGKDYKDPEQMKAVVDWAVQNLGPNVLKYTTDQADAAAAVRVGRDRRGRVLEQPRPAGIPGRPPGGGTARATDHLPGQWLPVGPEGRPAPGARPGLHELAAREGRPVPECVADRSRPVE